MSCKDISDIQVCESVRDCRWFAQWPYQLLAERTGQPEKVCYRAMERACRRGLIEYGVSLRSGWLTEKGQAILRTASADTVEITQESLPGA